MLLTENVSVVLALRKNPASDRDSELVPSLEGRPQHWVMTIAMATLNFFRRHEKDT
jgi:hypothetical protein